MGERRWRVPMGLFAVLAGVAFAAGACRPRAGDDRAGARPVADPPGSPLVYVAVGASESVGIGAERPADQAWPVVLHRTALPAGSVLVNLGVPGATVADALRHQLPRALARGPQLVTVWLNVNDILRGVPPSVYEEQLGRLVNGLRRGGATSVLVANTPDLRVLPVYHDCRAAPEEPTSGCPSPVQLPSPAVVDAVVDAYNDAIARVARREGALVVDLHGAGLAAMEAGTAGSLVSTDGFHPSAAGHRAVADVFARTLPSHLGGQEARAR